MSEWVTERLVLRPFSIQEATHVVAGKPRPPDWAPDYPFADEIDVLQTFIAGAKAGADSYPFVPYQVLELAPERDRTGVGIGRAEFLGGRPRPMPAVAVGGVGLAPRPERPGAVEIGYGFVRSARGRGLATEAVMAALEIARSGGATRVTAKTRVDNAPSRAVLRKTGFVEVAAAPSAVTYEHRFTPARRAS